MSLLGRAGELRARLNRLAHRPRWRVGFLPSEETSFISYFPADIWDDFKLLAQAGLDVSPYSESRDPFDIVLLTAHGSDKSAEIWRIRQCFPDALLCAWFWDNHLGPLNNLRTAVAADLLFASHAYAVDNLVNLGGALAAHLPACSAQWTRDAAGSLYGAFENQPRSDRLLVNYVDYGFAWRSTLLRRLAREAPEADVLLMPPGDRKRYFGKSPADRMREWMGYKASLCLPIDRDLSTRVFDALLSGHILVMPHGIPDVPSVIGTAIEERLGIIRLAEISVDAVRQAALLASRRFDEGGLSAARDRHMFVMERHMLVHRVEHALAVIRQLTAGGLALGVGSPANLPFGLYVSSQGAT
jgi:hypothetical protein